MAGRGSQTFQKRQKEQQRKEKQQEKMAKRLMKKQNKGTGEGDDSDIEPLTEAERMSLEEYNPA